MPPARPPAGDSGVGAPAAVEAAAQAAVQAAADELYALAPEQFVARRDELARAARARRDPATAKAVAGLRRPTLGAWLVNLLVRHEREPVEQLLALGEALREAERSLSGEDLRRLSAQRSDVVAALVAAAVALGQGAGARVSAAARAEVQSTLQAALAVPEVAAAVREGRLVKPAEYAGFGGLDPEGADAASAWALTVVPAGPAGGGRDEAGHGTGRGTAGARRAADEERAARKRAEAQRALEEAEQALAAAQAQRDRAEVELEETETARAALTERLEQLREQVHDVERRLAEEALALRAATRSREEGQRALARAEAAVARARSRLPRP